MFDELDASAALGRIDDWEEAISRRAEQTRQLADRTAALSASAQNETRSIQVTVDHQGQIIGLKLEEGIRRQPAADTAREILTVLAAAKADLLRRFDEIAAATVGADTATGQALMASARARLAPTGEAGREATS